MECILDAHHEFESYCEPSLVFKFTYQKEKVWYLSLLIKIKSQVFKLVKGELIIYRVSKLETTDFLVMKKK